MHKIKINGLEYYLLPDSENDENKGDCTGCVFENARAKCPGDEYQENDCVKYKGIWKLK